MGLYTTHDCWQGSCQHFNDWRQWLVKEAWGVELGGLPGFRCGRFNDFEHHDWPEAAAEDPLMHLIDYSDCDGVLKWEICSSLADRLVQIAEASIQGNRPDFRKTRYTFQWEAVRFASGLRRAFAAQEDVEFS